MHVGKGVTGLQTTTNKSFAYYFICRCWFDLKHSMFKKMHWGALLAFQELTKKLQDIIDFIEHYLLLFIISECIITVNFITWRTESFPTFLPHKWPELYCFYQILWLNLESHQTTQSRSEACLAGRSNRIRQLGEESPVSHMCTNL